MTEQPKVDATDLYFFRSYEPGRDGFVTVIANYISFQDPFGGPNFYQFDENTFYEVHFDTNGDAKEDLTFQFRVKNESKGASLSFGGQQIKIPLINSGPIDSVNAAALNVRETYTIDMVRGERRGGNRTRVTSTALDKPVDNIGEKSFASGYNAYAGQHVHDVSVPGCGNVKVFVGQRFIEELQESRAKWCLRDHQRQ